MHKFTVCCVCVSMYDDAVFVVPLPLCTRLDKAQGVPKAMFCSYLIRYEDCVCEAAQRKTYTRGRRKFYLCHSPPCFFMTDLPPKDQRACDNEEEDDELSDLEQNQDETNMRRSNTADVVPAYSLKNQISRRASANATVWF